MCSYSGAQPATGTTGSNSTPSGGGTGGISSDVLQNILAQVQGTPGPGGGNTVPLSQSQQLELGASQLQQAEVMYQTQLEQLQTMGFHNRQANLNGKVILNPLSLSRD